MENQKSKKGLYVLLGLLIGLIVCAVVLLVANATGYVTFGAKEETSSTEQVQTPSEEETEAEEPAAPVAENNWQFDTSKVANANGSYTLTVPTHADGINISLDAARTTVTLSINATLVNEAYSLGWFTAAESYVYEPHNITFNQKVVDIFFGGIGQDATGDVILFLMEDGTVEYIPVKTALQAGMDNLKSYGALSNLTDVVKFYQANATSYVTILAQTKDGTMYDLQPIIPR